MLPTWSLYAGHEWHRFSAIDHRQELPYISPSVIFDSLTNADSYFTGDWWRDTIAFLRSATPTLADGEHVVRARQIIARVHTGQTTPRASAMLESHQAHVDVHVVLEGEDALIVWPASRLQIRTPYNQAQDVVFYDPPAEGGVPFTLRPGSFAVLFPQDAHMTQIAQGESTRIKKLVMKVAVELVGLQRGDSVTSRRA